jgi:hypothetical protein
MIVLPEHKTYPPERDPPSVVAPHIFDFSRIVIDVLYCLWGSLPAPVFITSAESKVSPWKPER